MKKPRIKAIDAVMGTGKSTWAIEEIKRSDQKYIVVLPYVDEITRYAQQLENDVNVSALDDRVYEEGTSKAQAFSDALEYSDCIIITHKLFEDHITRETLRRIEEDAWRLLIDETLGTFEEQHGLDWHDIEAFKKDGIADVQRLTQAVSRLILNESIYDEYMTKTKVKKERKDLVRNLLHRDFLIVNTEEGKDDYYMYTLSPRLLNAFKGITLLTYLFQGSEMDLWCQFNGYQVDHMELVRNGSGHRLQPHCGVYSGVQFNNLVEVVAPQGRGKRYGNDQFDLSNNQMKRLSKDSPELKEIKQGLRNFSIKYKFDHEGDFLFTCKKEIIEKGFLLDRQQKLYRPYVGEQNWLAFNARGLNEYKDKHYVFYGMNVFQWPRVSLTLKGLGFSDYNQDHHALSMMLQFLWRSAIRVGEKIIVAVPSRRMRELLNDWLKGQVRFTSGRQMEGDCYASAAALT